MRHHAQGRTYRYVKQYVTRNVLSDIVPLNVRAISDRLDVSQVPVREALFRISHEGLIDFVSGEGFFARSLSRIDLAQACAISRGIAIFGLQSPDPCLRPKPAGIVSAANRCRDKLSTCADHSRAFWWVEAVLRRLIRRCYHREARWHLIRILDRTLAFRRTVSRDHQAAYNVAASLAKIASEIAEGDFPRALASIETLHINEEARLLCSYSAYNEALTRVRRAQNGVYISV
ncbi:hypothetical protein BJF93_09050 [Xaviernesmea oryzae]|uniref:HTH gntR-type domain-containing protein n=1 Tax=Xaviernesmea oryzae TaxID=464029 RepID=A0A1Q9B3Q9_9HYPH|nr:GntR family transcriptional regulator [Xaviernesmea oryzae]OLP62684.1 hypothetical protein BJF93_09050 [Xaviernesmea oryzae]SEM36412.1 DNA-binding transcriptional regulator, GntR family [Xaviernesmea oryzae]